MKKKLGKVFDGPVEETFIGSVSLATVAVAVGLASDRTASTHTANASGKECLVIFLLKTVRSVVYASRDFVQ
jgi:hypothetical protein